jgi:hypothetical protein
MLKKAFLLLLLVPSITFAGKLDRIRKAIDNNEYLKALELIEKSADKEPFNPGVSYFKALLYQTPNFRRFNLDTARITIQKSINDFKTLDLKTIEELANDGITSEVINLLQIQIRDQQFQRLLSDVTVETVKEFRLKYPSSIYDDMLEYKRDSIEFIQVQENRSEQIVSQFIVEYPTSKFLPFAKDILDETRFIKLRKTGKLSDYYLFLKQYPQTNFRTRVESYILKYATLGHSPKSYLDFINMATNKHLKKQAADLLYYIPNQEKEVLQFHPLNDSIQNISKYSSLELFPVIDRSTFGFYTTKGVFLTDYAYDDIQEVSKCHTTTDDWIFVSARGNGFIIDKQGNKIVENVDDYINLSDGVALVSTNGSTYLYHKSGFKIIENPVSHAEVLKGRWIKTASNGKSQLISFLGIPITETQYDNISLEGDFWVFVKRGLLAVYTEEMIAEELQRKGLSLEFKFDNIELVGTDKFIGFRDKRECLLDRNLKFLIPWGNYIIHPDESGWYLKSDNGYQLYNSLIENVMADHYSYMESNKGWLALKAQDDWILVPRKKEIQPSRGYDSLKLINNFVAFTNQGSKNELLFNNGNLISISTGEEIKTYSNSDFISVRKGGSITIYDKNGSSMLAGKFDQISFLNDTLLKVEVKKKQGLMNTKGEYILQPIFNVLDKQMGMIFLLLDGKIGAYDIQKNVVFMPKYETRLEKIGDHYIAKKNGKSGLIDQEEQPILNFKYDEIRYWNDTSYLVKVENQYDFINSSERSIVGTVELMTKVVNTGDQEIWKYVKEGKYGLISTQKGILLKPEYTDIFNIGTDENPLFFADQHLDKAGFHVVSYINKNGELVLSKAYNLEEFDKVLCED